MTRLGPGAEVDGGVVWRGGEKSWESNAARGWRDGQRKAKGPSESGQATGKVSVELTRPAKMKRRAEEGVGERDKAEGFFKSGMEDGRGIGDLCLAIPSAKH